MATAEIDVKKIQDIALLGVRRAAVFMGLGINAARDSRFREYELAHITGIDLVPVSIDGKTIDHFKDEFELWIIESGFRELLERFALFLDSINHHSLLLAIDRKGISPENAEKLQKKFEYIGIAGKLQQLEDTFGMSFQHAHYLETLAQARNCLTHRLGRVGAKDCGVDGYFELRWRSFDLLVDAPDRKEPVNLTLPIQESFYFAEGGTLQVRIVDRVRRFAKGGKLALSSKDLAEICHFVILASHDVSKAMVDYAKSIGTAEDYTQHTQQRNATDG